MSSDRLRERWTEIDGLPIFARVADEVAPAGAQPIVLVHGYGVSSRYMVPIAEALAPCFLVYAPDLPGSGRSGNPDSPLDLAELADCLATWMREIGLTAAVLLGNSFGCQIIVELALRHPALVSDAVLVGPTVNPKRRSAVRQLLLLALDALRERPALIAINLRDYWRFGPRRALETLRFMLADRIEEKLPRVTIPVLVVRGERDPIVPQRWAERVAELLPKGELAVIPEAAHAVNYGRPEELAEAVTRFLGTMRGQDNDAS